MELLSNAQLVALDWAGYYALPEVDQLVWEQRADALNQLMLYQVNLKNKLPRRIYVWLIPKGTIPLIHPISNQ